MFPKFIPFLLWLVMSAGQLFSQPAELSGYDPVWTTQSVNSSQSMPCGGGDIGLNVWVENGDLLCYVSRSGSFDENNAFLKSGRIRVKLFPNPFTGSFRQQLVLKDGYIAIDGGNGSLKTRVNIWVDVFRPVVHIRIDGNKPLRAEAFYETWRFRDRTGNTAENAANSYKWASQFPVKTWRDTVRFEDNQVLFYHRNREQTVFDVTVKQQGLEAVKDSMFNPLRNLTFGGILRGTGFTSAGTVSGRYLDTDFTGWKLQSRKAARSHQLELYLHTQQSESMEKWHSGLQDIIRQAKASERTVWQKTREWWHQYWDRSYIFIKPGNADETDDVWQAGRNYQLFRYMLGCNAYGEYPTKFNGGLFTYDPVFTDTSLHGTPDHRRWGGGTMTAQNQRLVYFPLLKAGDIDLMKPQFDFYLRSLRNAELRSKVYWGHKGASFTEQIENFGLPNCTEYGWKRPEGYDPGMEYNAWLEYQWDTVLEFCLMMLETERYAGQDITVYIPFIESCLRFFDEHYQYLARQRGSKALDAGGHLILYPGSAAETYKMAYNASSTIAGLQTILRRLLELPASYGSPEQRKAWTAMLSRIPPISFTDFNGHKTIAPALHWERINNTESPQLYPVFPWGLYGKGKPDLDIALNTWKYDTNAVKFRSYIGWKQDNIFAARLGLTEEAARLTVLKLKNSGRRFPAFWGPGFDWVPDHNWGGSGMIGLQEMLLQVDGEKIFLLPAWPSSWDVYFKLHAPYSTTIEGVYRNGKMESLTVLPESRRKDIQAP